MRTTAMTLALALLAGCSSGGTPAPKPDPSKAHGEPASPAVEAHEDETEEHPALPTKVRLSPEVTSAAHIRVAPATSEVLPITVQLTGEIAADPDHAAKVTARVVGRVVLVRFKEGQKVKRGAVLAIIESPELARARAALTSTRARAQAARRNAERIAHLADKGLAAGQEAASAAADATALVAEEVAARQTLAAFGRGATVRAGAARMAVRSPIAGSVLKRDAIQGQNVSAEHVLADLADLDHLYFLGRVFEKDLARIAVGAEVAVRLNAFPSEPFTGKVEAIGSQLDATARTVIARINLRNHEGRARIGLFGTALVSTTERTPALPRVVVPDGALTKITEHDVVFVRQPDGDYEIHRVTLGRSASGKVEILSGLRAGEPVVVDGVFTLKSAVLKSTFGEED